jgi:pimeloyl-ACP methyl ester carboxylesterase
MSGNDTAGRWRGRLVIALSAAAALAAGVLAAPHAFGLTGTHTAGTRVDHEAELARVAVPKLTWQKCEKAFQCATAAVPMDYDSPGGKTITLALSKRPADDQEHRIGTLFFNPGGPGASAIDMMPGVDKFFPPEALQRFDIVGMDPRGVSRSTPMRCYDNDEDSGAAAAEALLGFPATPDAVPGYLADMKAHTDACARHAGPIIDHMSTANVARDLDMLRRAVGDEQLSYYGMSYGTYLGTVYANMFPRRVRALVLDGAIDPLAWAGGEEGSIVFPRTGADVGAHKTLQRFFELCDAAGPGGCALTDGTEGTAKQRFDAVAEQLKAEPMPIGNGQTITYSFFVGQTLMQLKQKGAWKELAKNVQETYQAISGGKAPTKASLTARTGGQTPPRVGNEEALLGVACAETSNPRSQAAWVTTAREREKKAPHFGSAWTYLTSPCATWPGSDDDRYSGRYDTETSAPALVVGTRFDPATAYDEAVTLSEVMPGAKLLTVEGVGHVAAGTSTCTARATGKYLVTGKVSGLPKTCEQDTGPFEG